MNNPAGQSANGHAAPPNREAAVRPQGSRGKWADSACMPLLGQQVVHVYAATTYARWPIFGSRRRIGTFT